MKTYAIVLAGGQGSRMNSSTPKQFLELEGEYIISYSLKAFEKSRADKIIIVVNEQYEEICSRIVKEKNISKFLSFASNGKERVDSVENGIEKVISDSGVEDLNNVAVLIHDGARPLISVDLINASIDCVDKEYACVPGINVKDTIKEININSETVNTPDRSMLRAVQTPQCFELGLIKEAYECWHCDTKGCFLPTDDASLVERYTKTKVKVIDGEEKNIKITTPIDLEIAKYYLLQ